MSDLEAKAQWQDLLEKDDRTSPAEYPDMALITFTEFSAALQSAHAAGEAEGDRAGYERGVKDAAAKYKQLHDWIAEQISRAKYNADELGQGLKAWDDIADSMRNGIMASFADNVLALLPAQPKEPK